MVWRVPAGGGVGAASRGCGCELNPLINSASPGHRWQVGTENIVQTTTPIPTFLPLFLWQSAPINPDLCIVLSFHNSQFCWCYSTIMIYQTQHKNCWVRSFWVKEVYEAKYESLCENVHFWAIPWSMCWHLQLNIADYLILRALKHLMDSPRVVSDLIAVPAFPVSVWCTGALFEYFTLFSMVLMWFRHPEKVTGQTWTCVCDSWSMCVCEGGHCGLPVDSCRLWADLLCGRCRWGTQPQVCVLPFGASIYGLVLYNRSTKQNSFR